MYTQPDPGRYLAPYVESYLRQEIIEEGRTRNLAAFSRFLELFTWRTGFGAGGDFVACGGDGLFAIEVKRRGRIRRADLQGLAQFQADYPAARCVLLFGGDRREYRDGVELLPLVEALADPTTVLR